MRSRSASQRRHLASSPFQPEPEEVVEAYSVDDRVIHDSYGLGRVVGVETSAITVDFGDRSVRLVSPYPKLEKL